MDRSDFKKGQEVFLRIIPLSSASRHIDAKISENMIIPVKVKTVGKKYITVENNWGNDVKFDIEDDFKECTKYSSDYELYLSKEELLREIQVEELLRQIRQVTNNFMYRYKRKKYTVDELNLVLKFLK